MKELNPNKLILLIDDDIQFSIGMVALLKREGYDVVNARNGKEGLESISRRIPDLILCDVMLPAPDGMQVKETINQNPTQKEIPFIFISAKTAQTEQEKAKQLGAIDYILKPFNVHEVLEKIESLLK